CPCPGPRPRCHLPQPGFSPGHCPHRRGARHSHRRHRRHENAQPNGFGALPPANPVKLLDAALLSITGSARLTASQTVPIVLQFSPDDIAAGTLKTARTQTIASSLVTSLFANLDLRVQLDLLGIGLNLNVIAASLRALLAPLALPLDALLASLLQTLGMGLGEADVRVYGVQCSDPVLVG